MNPLSNDHLYKVVYDGNDEGQPPIHVYTKWLDGKGVDYTSVHLVEKTPSKTKLKDLWKRSGLPVRKFFNTSGNSYRNGGFKAKLETMNDSQAIAALAADGMLIKRPILDAGDSVLRSVLQGLGADRFIVQSEMRLGL